MLVLSAPKLENITHSIEEWFKANFVKALVQPQTEGEYFKFGKIAKITRVWKNNEFWTVETFVEYSYPNPKLKTFTFQVDCNGEILGFDLNEPSTRIMSI